MDRVIKLHLKYIVDDTASGKSVKYVLKNRLELSERLVKRLKYSGNILCNSAPVHVNAAVCKEDVIEVFIDFTEPCEDIIPENILLDILYEDDCLIVINKQPNIVVHPTCSHPSGTIANAVMYHLKSKGVEKKVRPVSRLDRDTSGIIIFAKNEFVQEALIQQMGDKTFSKEYIGVVHGIVPEDSGTINRPIERKPGSIMLRHVSETGQPSVTHFHVMERLNNATLLKFSLETGRTHQIRVHCQAMGYPLIGDTLYSDIPTSLIGRQALHSCKVVFIHPFTKERTELTAPIPSDINNLIITLKN